MVALPSPPDPTLAAVDRQLEALQDRWRSRGLSMGLIGEPCDRKMFYYFRWATTPKPFSVDALKRFADGHTGEALQAKRLRLVEEITLWTVDPERDGKQYAVSDHGGHLQGRIDGVILGLLQAPNTPHIWEHKQVEEKSQRKLEKYKEQLGEKNALFAWKPLYWATAQVYMHYVQLDRHYMTVASPGGRHSISVRTEYNAKDAKALVARAAKVIEATCTPPKLSHDPSWHECRWCDHHAVCHQGEKPPINCRTCLASTPVEGGWRCDRWDMPLSFEQQQAGCRDHLYLPSLIDGEQTDAADDGAWVEYRMRDGSTWRNEVEVQS